MTSHLTTREFAQLHGVARATVRLWLARGWLPGAVRHEAGPVRWWSIPAYCPRPQVRPGRRWPRQTEPATISGREVEVSCEKTPAEIR